MHISKKVPVPNYRILTYKYQNKQKKNCYVEETEVQTKEEEEKHEQKLKKKKNPSEEKIIQQAQSINQKKIMINYQIYQLLMINYESIHFEQISTLFRVFSRR